VAAVPGVRVQLPEPVSRVVVSRRCPDASWRLRFAPPGPDPGRPPPYPDL